MPLLEVRRWDLQLSTGYALVRNGRVAAEEGSPAVEQLNDALRSGDDDSLFGGRTPLTTKWSFVARDLVTGRRVPVAVGPRARPGEVRVEVLASTPPGEEVSIWFPSTPESHLLEVVGTAKIADVFGVRGELQHRVHNYLLLGPTPESLGQAVLSSLASAAGRTVGELVKMASAPKGPEVGDAAEAERRRARALRLKALHDVADRQITMDELRVLIALAGRLRKN